MKPRSTSIMEKRWRRHIPAELVEEILSNLPVKSLLCFSAVSKSWNRMIKSPEFRKRYRGREMKVLRIYPWSSADEQKALACPLSLSSLSIANASPFALPFTAAMDAHTDVSCGELRCVEFENSLCLYNPSMRTYRKLPPPSGIGTTATLSPLSVFAYGLGFDSVSNDYKILKIDRSLRFKTELYSLAADCWSEVADFKGMILRCMPPLCDDPGEVSFLLPKGMFVGGALHWLVQYFWYIEDEHRGETETAILCFHLSTNRCRKVAPPKPLPAYQHGLSDKVDMCVIKERLCLYMNDRGRFVVWLMDNNYGCWNKDLEINYANIPPPLRFSSLKPFYSYDDAGNLIRAVTSPTDIRKIFIVTATYCFVEKSFGDGYGILDTNFTYVESFVSPASPSPHSSVSGSEMNMKRKRDGSVTSGWTPFRGMYPDPTYKEYSVIGNFLSKFPFEDDDFIEQQHPPWISFKNHLGCPNLRPLLIKFLRQVRESKGYDVDMQFDFSGADYWWDWGFFFLRCLNEKKFYDKAMAASKFAIRVINGQTKKRYGVVRADKLVSTTNNTLLLTFTAKEIITKAVETFQAMLQYGNAEEIDCNTSSTSSSIGLYTFQLKEWKFKALTI